MAIVTCHICNGKQFKNDAAYQQHARDNKAHQMKALAARKAGTPAATSSRTQKTAPPPPPPPPPPPAEVPKPGYCKTCKADFGSPQKLQAHFERGDVRYHPKCLKCSRGFENHAVLEEHRKSAHPLIFCQRCKKYRYLDEWAKHNKECATPPSPPSPPPPPRQRWGCPVCSALENSEEDVKKHIVAVHPEICCYTCGLAFRSDAELATHYFEHAAHPTCNTCGSGFMGELEYHVHMEEKHDLSSPEAYVCEACDREFWSLDGLEKHNADNHPAPLASVPEWEEDENPFHSEPSAGSPSSDLKGKGVDRGPGFPTRPERIVPRPGHTMPLSLSKEEEFYSDVSSDSAIEVTSTSVPTAPQLLRVASAPSIPSVYLAKPVILDEIVDSPEPWTDVQLVTDALEEPDTTESGNLEAQRHHPLETRRSTSSSPVVVQEKDAAETPSPLSSATISTAYHSVARVPSPNRAISRLSLYTAYRHPSGNTPAPESSSGIASPGSAHSLLFTLAQSMRKRSVDDTKSVSPESSPKVSCGSSLLEESIGEPSASPVYRPVVVNASDSCDECEGVLDVDRAVTTSMSTESEIRTEETTDVSSECAGTAQIPERISPAASDSAATSTGPGARSQSCQDSSTSDTCTSVPQDSGKPTVPRIPSRFQCRVCSGNPVEPTVTMCGHLFCRSCIVGEISKNLQCPVCRTVMLVRLFVD